MKRLIRVIYTLSLGQNYKINNDVKNNLVICENDKVIRIYSINNGYISFLDAIGKYKC